MADFALSVSLVPLAYADISDHLGSSSIICRSVASVPFSAASYMVLLEALGSRPAPMRLLPHLQPVAVEPRHPESFPGMELIFFAIVSSSVDRLKISFLFLKHF